MSVRGGAGGAGGGRGGVELREPAGGGGSPPALQLCEDCPGPPPAHVQGLVGGRLEHWDTLVPPSFGLVYPSLIDELAPYI